MSIHIKPENRGKFTALKKRTGKSASWFKAHGTPAQKKMATFALNAKKWKHAEGGELFAWEGDMGEEHNSKVRKLQAINDTIAKYGEQFGGMFDTMNGSFGNGQLGGSDPEGIKANANTDFLNIQYSKMDNYKLPNNASKLNNGDVRVGTGINTYSEMNSSKNPAFLKACGGKLHCGGGNLFDYGGDFSNGQTMYNTGGTHEENPYEGVQVGVDNQGTPNLVEEGEVRYQDYIFSNRLSLDEDMAKKYNIPKKYADATFAYIAEKMGEESKEREYDPISQRGLKANMEKLRGAQEEVKAIKAQEEMMQQVQQIADELGVAPEDVLAAMQMQQEEQLAQQQQPSPEEMQMMQQQQMEQMPEEEQYTEAEDAEPDSYEGTMFENTPYALGGALAAYSGNMSKGFDYSNPQKTSTLFDMYAEKGQVNKYDDGTPDVNNPDDPPTTTIGLLESFLSDEDFWDKTAKVSLDAIIKDFSEAYNKATTDEQRNTLRAAFINDFNNLQKSYAVARNTSNPKIFSKAVAAHQKLFNEFQGNKGNLGFKGVEKWLKKGNRRILKDTTNAGFTPDGHFQVETRARHLGTNQYEDKFKNYYASLNSILNPLGIKYGVLDDEAMRYNDNGKQFELNGLSEYSPEAVSESEEEPRSIYDNVPMGDNTPTYTSYESIGETTPRSSTTTSSNNPQSPEQRTGEQQKVYNTAPKYSMLDFVPLWQYLTARRPDYSQADALVNYTNRMPKPTYKPIGDYVQYHPFDRQYAAEQQRQRTAATIRNNWNTSGGNRGYAGAMNLAANYQGQLADAEMQRQADAANLAQRMQVAQFNRGTNQFNAEAFNRLELQKPYQYQLGLQARAQRAAMHNALDNAYSAAKSTNLNTWINNMYARRREAQDRAQFKWLADRGVFGNLGEDDYPYAGNDYLWEWLRNGNWKKNNNGSTNR